MLTPEETQEALDKLVGRPPEPEEVADDLFRRFAEDEGLEPPKPAQETEERVQ